MKSLSLTVAILAALLFPSIGHCSPPPGVLEQFELSSLKLVSIATFPAPCENHAYFEDPNGYRHLVMVGTPMGKKNGYIREISPEGVRFVELVPDGKDGWKESEILIKFPSQQPTSSQSNNSFKADKSELRSALRP